MAAMTLLMLVNITILDILAGLLQKHTRERTYVKSAGLLALLLLAFQKRPFIHDKKTALKRFFLACTTAILLIGAYYLLFRDYLLIKAEPWIYSDVAMLVLIAMPFYHLLYGLLGSHTQSIHTTIKNFRLRAMLGFIIGAHLFMAHISTPQNLLFQSIHAFFIIIALVHIFYLSSLPRAFRSFYTINYEDYDALAPMCIYYFTLLLEFFLYVLFFYFFTGPSIINLFTPNNNYIILLIIIIYLICFVLAKILLVSRVLIKPAIYENYIIPMSFIFFSIGYIYELTK